MNKVVGLICVMSMVVLTSFRVAGDKDDWKLCEDKNGIKVYTKKSEQGKIRTSKAQMFVDVPPSKVIEALLDFNSYAKWFPSCYEAKILKRVSDNEFVSHLIYKTPWLLPNLDCVQRMVIDRKAVGDTTFIRVKAEPDFMGPSGSCVRVKQMQGLWEIVAVKGGSMLTNTYYTDMGGIIPYWLANTQSVEIPYNIFNNMRQFITTGKGKK
jgi:START domain